MPQRVALMALAGIVISPLAAASQGVRVTVRGLAYDSLRGRPLFNASITTEEGRKTTSDARGRFRFDDFLPGVHSFVMRHALLDSVGLPGIARRVTVTDGRHEVRVAIPSFATLWRAACGDRRPPKDSGFVYGTIRDAWGRDVVANASVEVSWTELFADRRRGAIQRRWRINTQSDANGSYTICGVPMSLVLRLRAESDSSASGLIDLLPRGPRALRRDLLVGPLDSTDTKRRGTIAGTLTDDAGRIFAEARVIMDEMPEVRSDADGRFLIQGVPAGTRQIEVRSFGAMPLFAVVDVVAGETVSVHLTLARLRLLRAMRITAPVGVRRLASEFQLRQRQGLGYSMDSTALSKYPKFLNVFHDIPSVQSEYRGAKFTITVPDAHGGRCEPEVRIDGAEATSGHLIDLLPEEAAALEVYPRAGTVPAQFLRPGIQPLCGLILVWTKYGFRNR